MNVINGKRKVLTVLVVLGLITVSGCTGTNEPTLTERDVKVLRQEVAEYREMVRRLEDKYQQASSELDHNLITFNSLNEEIVALVEERTALTEERDNLMRAYSRNQEALREPTPWLDSILVYLRDKYYLADAGSDQDKTFYELSMSLSELSYWLSDRGAMPIVEKEAVEDNPGNGKGKEKNQETDVMEPWHPVDTRVFDDANAFVERLWQVFEEEDVKSVFETYVTFDPLEDKKLLIHEGALYTRIPQRVLSFVGVDASLYASRIFEMGDEEKVYRLIYPKTSAIEPGQDIELYEEKHTFYYVKNRWVADQSALQDTYAWQSYVAPFEGIEQEGENYEE